MRSSVRGSICQLPSRLGSHDHSGFVVMVMLLKKVIVQVKKAHPSVTGQTEGSCAPADSISMPTIATSGWCVEL